MTSHIIKNEDGLIDLTKIEKPFGLLPEEVKEALKAYDHVETYSLGEWRACPNPLWESALAYRAKPIPTTKPSIDWSQVNPRFKWLARDNCCDYCYLFEDKPILEGNYWQVDAGRVFQAEVFTSMTLGTCAWNDSLVKRPD